MCVFSLRHIAGVVDVEKCNMPEIAGYPHGNYGACFSIEGGASPFSLQRQRRRLRLGVVAGY